MVLVRHIHLLFIISGLFDFFLTFWHVIRPSFVIVRLANVKVVKVMDQLWKEFFLSYPFSYPLPPQPSKGPVLRARRREDWHLSKPPVQILWSRCSRDHLPGAPAWPLSRGLRRPPVGGRGAQQERVQWRWRWTRVTERIEETERGMLEKGEMFHDKMEKFFCFLSLSPFSLPFALSFS